MAVGDLVTEPYMFEYNGLVMGATTDYDLLNVQDLLGFSMRSDSVDSFGRHGGTLGRHYGSMKNVSLEGRIYATSDTDFETKRQAIGAAFAPIVETEPLPFVTMMPSATSLKIQTLIRPLKMSLPIDLPFSRNYATFVLQVEQTDPILQALIQTTVNFAPPTDSKAITNNGNAPASWIGTLVGPCESPILTNTDTGQVIQFEELTLTGAETLVYDSGASTVKVNDVSKSTVLSSGFSWWDLEPGVNNISFTATNADTAAFSIAYRDSYWIV